MAVTDTLPLDKGVEFSHHYNTDSQGSPKMRWGEWVVAEKLSWAEAGRRVGVTTSEARHFASGRIPRRPTMGRIYLLTGGQVTPNDFYDLPPLPEGSDPDSPPCECRRVA